MSRRDGREQIVSAGEADRRHSLIVRKKSTSKLDGVLVDKEGEARRQFFCLTLFRQVSNDELSPDQAMELLALHSEPNFLAPLLRSREALLCGRSNFFEYTQTREQLMDRMDGLSPDASLEVAGPSH